MRRIAIFISTMTLLYVMWAFTASYLIFSSDKFKQEIAKAEKQYGVNLKAVEVKAFPWPHLHLKELEIPGLLVAQKISADISFIQSLMLNPKFSTINIGSASIKISDIEDNIKDLYSQVNEAFTTFELNSTLNIDHLTLYSNNDMVSALANVENITLSRSSSSIYGSLSTNGNNINYSFDKQDQNYNYDIIIDDLQRNIKALGNLTPDTNKGQIEAIAPSAEYLFTQNSTIIANTGKTSLKADFTADKDNLSINNINIDSKQLSLTGQVKYNYNTNFINIDSNVSKASYELYNKILPKISFITDPNKHIGLNLKLSDISLNDIEVKEAELIAESLNGNFKVNLFNATLTDETKIEVKGELVNSGEIKKFEGTCSAFTDDLVNVSFLKFLFDSKNLNKEDSKTSAHIDAKLTIDKYNYQVNDIKLQTSDGEIITGSISYVPSLRMPRISSQLKLTDIDLASSKVPFAKYVASLFKQIIFDSQHDEAYANYFTPIRNLKLLGDTDISLENASYNNIKLPLRAIKASFEPSKIDINHYEIENNECQIEGLGSLIASGIKPIFQLDITNGACKTLDLSKENIIALNNYINNNFDPRNFSISSNIYFKSFGPLVSDLKLAISNDKNLFKITDLKFKRYSGDFTAQGNYLVGPNVLNLSLGYTNFDLPSLVNIAGIASGSASLSGTLSMQGLTAEEIDRKTSFTGNFLSSNTNINDIGLGNFIASLNQAKYPLNRLEYDSYQAVRSGSTIIDNAKGQIRIDGNIITLNNVIFNNKFLTGTANISIDTFRKQLQANSNISFNLITGVSNPAFQTITEQFTLSGSFDKIIKKMTTDKIKENLALRNAPSIVSQ